MSKRSSKRPYSRISGQSLRRRVRLRQLELLAALEHAPTLSAAAREVRLSQPAASKLLGTLSQDLAVELFEKAGRSLRPTPAGRALIRHAANLVGNLDRAQAEIEAIESGLSGTVAVGAGIGACYVLMPRALQLLLDQAPDIVVTMREGAMEEHFAMLRDGRLDLVVGRVEPALVDRDFAMDELYDPAILIVAGPQHPLARSNAVSWSKLVEQDWILPQEGTPMRAGIERIFRRVKRRPSRCMIESSSIQTNVSLMNARDMLWVLSEDITAYFEALGLLRRVPVEMPRTAAALSVVRMRGPDLSNAARRLLDCLHQAADTIAMNPGLAVNAVAAEKDGT
ncbi:LysR family transcriptional regulator [Pseudorhodoplanes sp.]|uniref:LysR family transcriptional regulator n=1 Tax=Pseudorhodoplanes sp. TaxID=1934341 RepID=UPI002BF92057|nr:LysR family transcriptional regulator [Pseudorhodoplanes sp.]HWV43782.1 LysR family transcriptional regulator [Pseudorhodoplanes sp.]